MDAIFSTNFIFKFMILFARIGAIFSLLPGFSESYVPTRGRLLIAILICFIAYPLLELPQYSNNFGFLLNCLVIEIFIGIMFGLMVKINFLALHTLGAIISMQSGLSSAVFFSPNEKQNQSSVFSNFFIIAVVSMIFSTGTHHTFIKAIISSYNSFPINQIPNMGDSANFISHIVNDSFILAFKMSSPFIVVSLAILTGSGLLSRLIPNFQVFFVITPAQILIIFSILFITIDSILKKMVFILKIVN